MKKPISLYDSLRTRKSIVEAWRVVYQNGISSKADVTREEIKEFSQNADRHINRICRQLREKKFKFSKSLGVLQKKPGKSSKRPIVISSIENRIVQRAILDALQSHPPLKKYFITETSFGGIKHRGVPDAVRMAYEMIRGKEQHFIRSDIKSFFTEIPKSTVISIVESTTNDNKFLELFKSAVNVELSNLEQLKENAKEFPIYDIGVAQGSCLSPLLGNILLHDFDERMNHGDITCIRYIDDFILFAPTSKACNAAFRRANQILSENNLKAYSPVEDKDKAEQGQTISGFGFLGCDVRPGIIRPNKRSKQNLLKKVQDIFSKSLALMNEPDKLVSKRFTVIETLVDVSNVLKGWGNQYSFCNDVNLLKDIDRQVDEKISAYFESYVKAKSKLGTTSKGDLNKRRLLGVHLLTDSKKAPIIK